PTRDRLDVLVLEEPGRVAAVPVLADERAAPAVALPDLALDLGRDVARVGAAAGPRSRLGGGAEPALLELRDGEIEQAIQHLVEIPRRNRVAEQVARVAEPVLGALPDLHVGEALRGGLGSHGQERQLPGGR